MSSPKDLIAARLAEEGRRTAAFFRSLSAAELDQPVYTAGPGWRARDLLTHLVSTERNIAALISDVLAGGPGAPEGFDIDAFNASETTGGPGPDLEEAVRQFEAARAATLVLLASTDESALQRRGRHPFLGPAPVEAMLKLLYRHTLLHERDARKALDSGAPLSGAA